MLPHEAVELTAATLESDVTADFILHVGERGLAIESTYDMRQLAVEGRDLPCS
jgi:hypothetical protein